MNTNYLSNEPYTENPIQVVHPTDTTGSSAYAYHYTLDGSTPDESDPLFTSDINLNYGQTLKVRRYGVGSSNSSNYPSEIMAVPNYTPNLILEECSNLYDQLVWEGNPNHINTFWNNKPLYISPFIKKIHDTYFLYVKDTFTNEYYYSIDSMSGSTAEEWDPLTWLYCKAIIFYSKDFKTWTPLPGFENDFTNSSSTLRGKLPSKYPLDIFYYEGKFHIIYVNIDPDKFETFIATDLSSGATGSTDSYLGSSSEKRVRAPGNANTFLCKKVLGLVGGNNTGESLNLYDYTVTAIGDSSPEIITIAENIENLPNWNYLSDNTANASHNLDSRLVTWLRAFHLITENRVLISLGSLSISNTDYSTVSNCLFGKNKNDSTYQVYCVDSDITSSTSNSLDVANPYFAIRSAQSSLNMIAYFAGGYFNIPGLYLSSSTKGFFYSKNFDMDNIVWSTVNTGNDSSVTTENPLIYDETTGIIYYSNYVGYQNSTLYNGMIYNNYINSSTFVRDNISSTFYSFYSGFYKAFEGFNIWFNRIGASYSQDAEDNIVCQPTYSTSSNRYRTPLPDGYKLYIKDTAISGSGPSLGIASMYPLFEDKIGYLTLFNSENEPVLFKISIENPTETLSTLSEELNISTMSLTKEGSKIYRLKTTRVSVEQDTEEKKGEVKEEIGEYL